MMVQKVAQEMKSVDLSLLAMQMAADPFAKIKSVLNGIIRQPGKKSAQDSGGSIYTC